MKIKRYIVDTLKWIVAILIFIVITESILIVNNADKREIGYSLAIFFFIFAMFLGYDFYKWNKKIETVDRLLVADSEIDIANVEQVIKEMTQVSEISELENKYQEIILAIINQNVNQRNIQDDKQRDMQDYYGMWVHQIKTPIAALRLLLQQKEDGGADEQAELFRIEQYVDMALQYVRIDSKDTDFVFENVQLEQVLRTSVRKFARQFIAKKITLDFKPTEAMAVTDAKWLGFVVDQVLSNAIKYTSKGTISISVENQDDTKIIIQDTGIGIRAEDLPRICERGYTGYNGHANHHSTGIGLYLCKQIIDKLGHEMEISSEESKGTRVEIKIGNNSNL